MYVFLLNEQTKVNLLLMIQCSKTIFDVLEDSELDEDDERRIIELPIPTSDKKTCL